jgi:hypothetical protein
MAWMEAMMPEASAPIGIETPATDDEAFFVSFEPQRALGVSLP